jgi:hypothetical protein
VPDTTAADLARVAGCNKSVISKWFSGTSVPSASTYVTSAFYLGFGILGYKSGQKQAAFAVAKLTIEEVDRQLDPGSNRSLQSWQCAALYYFIEYVELFGDTIDEIDTKPCGRTIEHIARLVAKDFPGQRITRERVFSAIKDWFDAFLVFYAALDASTWTLFVETDNETLQ